MLWRSTFSTYFQKSVKQEWIHADGHAVGLQRGFVMDIDFVVFYLANILICGLFIEKTCNFSSHQLAVDLDIDILIDFSLHGCDVFGGYICVCIHRRSRCGVACFDIILDKINFFIDL